MPEDIVTTEFDFLGLDETLLRLDLLEDTQYDMLYDLQEKTGVKFEDIPLNDEKGLTEEQQQMLQNLGVQEWYSQVCQKICYLFPKSYVIYATMMMVRLAYYKVYYPNEYENVLKKIDSFLNIFAIIKVRVPKRIRYSS